MIKCHTARKEHICDLCHLKIPIGHKYWRDYDIDTYVDRKEHTNCELYKEPEYVKECEK